MSAACNRSAQDRRSEQARRSRLLRCAGPFQIARGVADTSVRPWFCALCLVSPRLLPCRTYFFMSHHTSSPSHFFSLLSSDDSSKACAGAHVTKNHVHVAACPTGGYDDGHVSAWSPGHTQRRGCCAAAANRNTCPCLRVTATRLQTELQMCLG
jgi:hypothetical protein